uniref:C-type lectin domain-containing protein n=1 Tax=Acrobeloides nanus TaxID=290746 RepID=A0A914DUW2_9BILA
MKQILFIFLIFIPYIKTEYISLPDNGWCVNFYENHQQISWPEAKIFCKSNEINNTDLAIIPVGEINKEFQNMSSTKFSNDSYWWANAFGIFDEISGYGHWDDVNNTKMGYKNMGDNSNKYTNTCLAISVSTSLWHTFQCNETAHFICFYIPNSPGNCTNSINSTTITSISTSTPSSTLHTTQRNTSAVFLVDMHIFVTILILKYLFK